MDGSVSRHRRRESQMTILAVAEKKRRVDRTNLKPRSLLEMEQYGLLIPSSF